MRFSSMLAILPWQAAELDLSHKLRLATCTLNECSATSASAVLSDGTSGDIWLADAGVRPRICGRPAGRRTEVVASSHPARCEPFRRWGPDVCRMNIPRMVKLPRRSAELNER